MTKTIIYTLAIVLLIIVGFVMYSNFLDIFIFLLELKEIKLVTTSVSGLFYEKLILGITLGSIPILQLIVNRIAAYKNKPVKSVLITITNILVFGIIFLIFKIIKIYLTIKAANNFDINNQIETTFSIKNLQFSLHLFIGFIIGAIVSIGVIKRKNREENNRI